MNCTDFTKCIDDYLDETCEEPLRLECARHLDNCPQCTAALQHEREMVAMLAGLPVPSPSPGFFDRALVDSMKAGRRRGIDRSGISSWRAAVGGALAAGLVAIALLGIFAAPDSNMPAAGIPELTLVLNAPDTVRLSFHSNEALPNARLILELPEGINVIGADGQRRVAWNTDIQRGNNILELPVIARNAGANGSILTAKIIHESRQKTFSIRIALI